MTPTLRFLAVAAVVAGSLAPATDALAWPRFVRPDLVLAGGGTFAVSGGEPDGGGLSFSGSALWAVTDRLRFGVQGYADDLGSTAVELVDRNDGTPLGTAADLHRWAYGAAWRLEADAWRLGRWSGGPSGALGYWRVEDDRRGTNLAAGSAVGFRLGADLRRPVGGGREVGFEVNYHRLTEPRNDAWRRADRYASAALEFRWRDQRGDD